MNAGVPDRESKDSVREIEVMSPSGAKLHHLPRERLRFGYRGSPAWRRARSSCRRC